MNRAELAEEIHETAKSKGFWNKERSWGEMMMLAVSELAEALEEHRDGKPDVYYLHNHTCIQTGLSTPESGSCNPKPEGFVIELADCIIRCYDSLYHLAGERIDAIFRQADIIMKFGGLDPLSDSDSDALYEITQVLTKVYASSIPSGFHLAKVILMCEQLIERHGHDTETAMRTKMDYNTTREYMHGKAY